MRLPDRLICLLLAAVMLLGPVEAFAKKRTKGVNDDKIVSVDAAAGKLVVTEGKNDAQITYVINKFTVITINGSPAKIADLKKGMHVDVQVGGTGAIASRVEAQGTRSPSKKKKSE